MARAIYSSPPLSPIAVASAAKQSDWLEPKRQMMMSMIMMMMMVMMIDDSDSNGNHKTDAVDYHEVMLPSLSHPHRLATS